MGPQPQEATEPGIAGHLDGSERTVRNRWSFARALLPKPLVGKSAADDIDRRNGQRKGCREDRSD